MWQDYVFAVTIGLFIVSLVPTIVDPKRKPPVATAALTVIPMLVNGVAFMSLDMWWAAIATGINALEWTIIGIQRYRIDRRERTNAAL